VKRSYLIVVSCLVTLLLVGGGLFFIVHDYLNSEAFKNELLNQVSAHLGVEVKVEKMKIRGLTGVDFLNIRLSSDHVAPREFARAERLRVRYHFFEALFHKRIVLHELRISAPEAEIRLEPIREGTAVHPGTAGTSPRGGAAGASTAPEGAARTATTPPGGVRKEGPAGTEQAIVRVPPAAPGRPPAGTFWRTPPAVELRSVVVEEGKVVIVLPDRQQVVLKGLNVQAALSTDPVPSVTGQVACQAIGLPEQVNLTDSALNFLWRADSLTIPRFTFHFLGGSLTGQLKVDPSRPDLPFELQTQIQGVNLDEMIRLPQGGPSPWGDFLGELQAEARFEGSALAPQQAGGQGQVRIRNGRFLNVPPLAMLGGLCNRSEFRDLSLQRAEMDFILQADKLQVPRVELISVDLQLTGAGWFHRREESMDLQMKFGFSAELARLLPSKLVEGAPRRVDGYREMPFRFWGNLAQPQNDLEQRFEEFLPRATGSAIFDKIYRSVPQSPEGD